MTVRFLADTEVVSETTRPKPDPQVVHWLTAEGRYALAAVSVYELARGIALVTSARKRAFLDDWLARLLARSIPVLAFDRDVALQAARIASRARQAGKGLQQSDLFIAATAAAHGLSLATHNVAHFSGLGISVFDPFTGSWSL